VRVLRQFLLAVLRLAVPDGPLPALVQHYSFDGLDLFAAAQLHYCVRRDHQLPLRVFWKT
jgi:hypothetical protein